MSPSITSSPSQTVQDIIKEIDAFHNKRSKSKEEVVLCEQCGKNAQLFGWAYCLECSIETLPQLAKGPRVFNSCELIAQHKGDYDHRSFGGVELDFTKYKQVFVKKSFKNCDFNDVKFSNADFHECSFKHVNFTGAAFSKANFSKCEFEYVDFTGTTFDDSTFRKATFQNCTIRYAKFQKCNFERSRLSKLQLLKTVFTSMTVLSGCWFEKTELSHTCFDNCLLHNTVFTGDEIVDEIVFSDCDLSNSDLTCAHINKIGILGNSNVAGLHLTYDQQEKIHLANNANWKEVKLVLIPTPTYARRSQLTFRQNLLIRDVCLGTSETVGIVFNCIAAGSFGGMVYCIISGAFEGGQSLVRPFFGATIICSGLLLVPVLWASIRLTKNTPVKVDKILNSD